MPLSTKKSVWLERNNSTACGRRVGPVADHVVPFAGAAGDLAVGCAVDRVDEVVAAAAEEGVGAEMAEEAVVAFVPDQDVGAVGALEALVVGADLVRGAAARGPPVPPISIRIDAAERP